MRKALLAASVLAGVAYAASANAGQIINFAQVGNASDVTATDTAGVTTIDITGAAVTVSAIDALSSIPAPISAIVSLAATSIDTAINVGSSILQHYSGTFSVTTAVGGINLLSGSFTDAAFGAGGGPGLVVNVNNPPDTLNLNSAAIPASELNAPSSLNFGFTALTSPLVITGGSIGSFGAAFIGNASATPAAATPEPASLAVLGVGLLGLTMIRRSRA